MFVPRYLPIGDVQCTNQLEYSGARRVTKLMNKRNAKQAQRDRVKNRHVLLAEKREQKIKDVERLRLQNLRYIDLSLLNEVRNQQKQPQKHCETVVQQLCASMTPFPIPAAFDTHHADLFETGLELSYLFETWPTKGKRNWKDVFALLQQLNATGRPNLAVFNEIQQRLLTLVVGEGPLAWETKNAPMAKIHSGGTAMLMFNDNETDGKTSLADVKELNAAMSNYRDVVWPEVLRRCLTNTWSMGCTNGSTSTLQHLLDPVRDNGVTLCLKVMAPLMNDTHSYLYTQVVNSTTLNGKVVQERYSQIVPEPMNLQKIYDNLMMRNGGIYGSGADGGDTTSTHEVAKTPPDHVQGASWLGEYEKCIIVGETQTTYDVKITSDGVLCQNVLKIYVRPLVHRSLSNTNGGNSNSGSTTASSSSSSSSSSTAFEMPAGCLEFARHVRLVFENCITFWETMVKEEDERQFAVKEQEEEATADANAELKAAGDEMYVDDNVAGNVGKREKKVKGRTATLLIVDTVV